MDTTNHRDAYRSYRQWDEENAEEIELERLTESFLGRVLADEGEEIINKLLEAGSLDDAKLNRLIVKIMHRSIRVFFGPHESRAAHGKLLITDADCLASRLWLLLVNEAEQEARRQLREMKDGNY